MSKTGAAVWVLWHCDALCVDSTRMCLLVSYHITCDATTITQSCFRDDGEAPAGAILVLSVWISTDQLWLSVVFCSPVFAHLTVFLSFPVGRLPPIVTRCVCAGGVSTVLCGRPSWIAQASCVAWIGIWFHYSLISRAPSPPPFVAASCWMHISKCAFKPHHENKPYLDNARANMNDS